MLHFLQIASGSASELEYQARLAVRLHFGDPRALESLRVGIESERRMLARLLQRIRETAK
jgi:S23 ribosomal protein.